MRGAPGWWRRRCLGTPWLLHVYLTRDSTLCEAVAPREVFFDFDFSREHCSPRNCTVTLFHLHCKGLPQKSTFLANRDRRKGPLPASQARKKKFFTNLGAWRISLYANGALANELMAQRDTWVADDPWAFFSLHLKSGVIFGM